MNLRGSKGEVRVGRKNKMHYTKYIPLGRGTIKTIYQEKTVEREERGLTKPQLVPPYVICEQKFEKSKGFVSNPRSDRLT
jgi:hypothetical protein